MVSANSPMHAAILAINTAFEKLEAAVSFAVAERDNSADAQSSAQAEITAGWEAHSAQLEAQLAEATADTAQLKSDNTRLSNQLQQVQQELLTLKTTANSTVKKLDKSVQQLDLILERA